MRGSFLTLLLLAACLALPAAHSAQTLEGTTPVPQVQAFPQLWCEIVYEVPGTQRCDVFGPLNGATELRVMLLGGAGRARVLVDDKSGPVTRQIAFADCTQSCIKNFDPTTSSNVAVFIYSEGTLGHSLTVAIQKAANRA